MIQAAVVGYGNIGRAAFAALQEAPDFEVCGIVRHRVPVAAPPELYGVEITDSVGKLSQKPDVALLCVPSRSVPETAETFLRKGIHTVDSFDIHSEIPALRERLSGISVENSAVSVISAGWDPGTDSVIRALLAACAPKGMTLTNFGPGMSMGHSVALRAVEGVKDAISITIPAGTGVHRRLCYVELQDGADRDAVISAIHEDSYFRHDETKVEIVPSVEEYRDRGHGVLIERKGVSGQTHNQRFEFRMQIDNPALTAQIMVSCARAATRQKPGCYTLIELPPVDLLPGERVSHIAKLV